MDFRIQSFDVDGRDCWTCAPESAEPGLPLLVMPAEAGMTETLPQVLEAVRPAIADGRCRPFVLAGFACDDWHRDLTPWPAPPLSAKAEPFAGNARETLAWLLGPFLGRVAADSGQRSLLGYSLAGLFALWAWLESGAFRGCASCSGSLWYDGWLDYALATDVPPGSSAYLSLGRAEERARNPRMAAVGDVTREYAKALADSPNVSRAALVWHDGGHFQDVPQRLADAIIWLAARDA